MSRILKAALCWVVVMGLFTLVIIWFNHEWDASKWSEDMRSGWLTVAGVVAFVCMVNVED